MKKLSVVLMWLLLFVPTAGAHTVASNQLKNVTPIQDKVLESALKSADEWWAKAGLRACPGKLYRYDEVNGAMARGDTPGCNVYFSNAYLRVLKIDLSTEYRNIRKTALHELWCTMVHERGHNLGFPHIEGGIMSEDNIVANCPNENWSTKMSKLTKTKSGDRQGKGVLRRDERLKRYEQSNSGKGETRHQHHKPGSMNMKKAGR